MIDSAVASTFQTRFVTALPSTGQINTIYFVVSNDGYKEYMWVNGGWELLGTNDIQLENYYTKAQVDANLLSINSDIQDVKDDLATAQSDASYAVAQSTAAVNAAATATATAEQKVTTSPFNGVLYCTESSFNQNKHIAYSDIGVPGSVPVVSTNGDLQLQNTAASKAEFDERYSLSGEAANTVLVSYGVLKDSLAAYTPSDVPTKTSQLTNDSGFITNTANNLLYYYTKSQVDQKFAELPESSASVEFADSTTITVSDTETGAKQFNLKADLVNDIGRSLKAPESTATNLRFVTIPANSTEQGLRGIDTTQSSKYGVNIQDNGTNFSFAVGNPGYDARVSGTTISKKDGENCWTYEFNDIITAVNSMSPASKNAYSIFKFKTGTGVTCGLSSAYVCKGDDCNAGVFTPQDNKVYMACVYKTQIPRTTSWVNLTFIIKVEE